METLFLPIKLCLNCTVFPPGLLVSIISALRIKANTFLLCGRSSALVLHLLLDPSEIDPD